MNIYFSLKQIEKVIDHDWDEDVGQNNNVVKTKTRASSAPVMKYPYLQKMSRRAASEISMKQHAELHLSALDSYLTVFHIKEFQQYWKNYDQLEQQKIQVTIEYKKEIESFENDPAQPFDSMTMDELQTIPFDERINGIKRTIYSFDVMSEVSGITSAINIKVNVKKYREDLKFCDKITTEMPKLQSKLGSLFPQLN